MELVRAHSLLHAKHAYIEIHNKLLSTAVNFNALKVIFKVFPKQSTLDYLK